MKTWKWTWKWNPRRIRMKLGSKTPGMIGAHRNQAVKIFLNKDVTSGDVKDVTSGDVRMVRKKKRPPQVCLLKRKRQGGQLKNNNINNISCHLGWLFDWRIFKRSKLLILKNLTLSPAKASTEPRRGPQISILVLDHLYLRRGYRGFTLEHLVIMCWSFVCVWMIG